MLGLKFGLLAVFLIGIPILLSILIFRFIKKRNYPSKYRLIALFPLIFVAYGLYLGLAKPYGLYEGHFEEITGLEIPASTEFLNYTDWGYGTYPAQNSSIFHIKVEADFYEKLKKELNPSTDKITGLKQEVRHRIQSLFDEDFPDQIDYQYSKFDSRGGLLYLIGFIETDHSLLVHAWKD